MQRKILIFYTLLLLFWVVHAEEMIISPVIESDPDIVLQTPEPTNTPIPDLQVSISCSRRAVMQENEPIYLSSKIINSEYYSNIHYQWQCNKGSGFENIAGATSSTYSFPATLKSLSWSWRLIVYYN